MLEILTTPKGVVNKYNTSPQNKASAGHKYRENLIHRHEMVHYDKDKDAGAGSNLCSIQRIITAGKEAER
jgi:hypothetical protein